MLLQISLSTLSYAQQCHRDTQNFCLQSSAVVVAVSTDCSAIAGGELSHKDKTAFEQKQLN